MNVALSIVIITWNQLDRLRNCLASLSDVFERNDIEIIIVDNGSTDGTIPFINEEYPQTTLIRNSSNRGIAFARNQGIRTSSGPKVMLLDNDTIANIEAITGMMQYMDNNPDVGICGCRLIDNDGRTQQSFKPYPGLGVKIRNILGKGCDYTTVNDTHPIEPTYIIGACQMISREVITSIGLLDEHIFYGPEDADYCLRARKAGFKVIYLPQYSIIHLWRRASRRNLLSLLSLKHFMALIYFYIKHRRLL